VNLKVLITFFPNPKTTIRLLFDAEHPCIFDCLGYVLAIRADDKGGCRLNAKGTQLLLKQLYGDVRIQLRPRA